MPKGRPSLKANDPNAEKTLILKFPAHKHMLLASIKELAEKDERSIQQMARFLLQEAINARMAKEQPSGQVSANGQR